jgi:hypothetical protein
MSDSFKSRTTLKVGGKEYTFFSLKALEEKYADQDVVFLAIHTAGTDMAIIQRLLNQEEWRVITAIDAGEDLQGSITAERYVVNGYPTVMVLDPSGKVHFNTGDFSRGLETLQAEMAERVIHLRDGRVDERGHQLPAGDRQVDPVALPDAGAERLLVEHAA